MIRALYTAASGMSAQQMNLDTIANNLANSSTTGFRQLRLQFQDMVYQNMVTPGAAQSQNTVSAGLQIGLGTKSAATEVINTQGELNETDNPLDVGDSGRRVFSGAAAGRHDRVHARRPVPPEQSGNHRDHGRRSADSDHHHSVECDGRDHHPIRRGERDPGRAAESLAAGTDSTGHVSQPRRPGKHGQQPAAGHAQLRRSGAGQPRAEPKDWERCSRGISRTRMWTW